MSANNGCDSKAKGDYGKIIWIGDSIKQGTSTFPTKYTVTVVDSASGRVTKDVTLWMVSVGRECGQGSNLAYVDRETNTLWFLTGIIELDHMGFTTYDDNGNQINKIISENQTINPMDFIDTFRIRANSASDGTEITQTMLIGNRNNGMTFQNPYLGTNQKGGKRKSRKSKKSKRHTRR